MVLVKRNYYKYSMMADESNLSESELTDYLKKKNDLFFYNKVKFDPLTSVTYKYRQLISG